MKGIIIAAGTGSRMGSLTRDRPKCMLPVMGRPLLDWTMERLRAAGCDEIVVVTGYKADAIEAPGAIIVHNDGYRDNNILHSLMYARNHLDGPVMVSYSDIWVEPHIHRTLVATAGDIVISVDADWQVYYQERTDHPVDEAENVLYDAAHCVRQIGKHLRPEEAGSLVCGEFLGLWRMSQVGARRFRQVFEQLDARLDALVPFMRAANWRRAYITDMLQELVDRGDNVACAVISRGWAELDTPQDYGRLTEIAERQRLHTLSRYVSCT